VHPGAMRLTTFDKFRMNREAEGVSIGSVDRDIATAARVLEEAARKWRDDQTNLTWLIETPMIEYQREYNIGRSWAGNQRRDSSASGLTTFGTRLDDAYVPQA